MLVNDRVRHADASGVLRFSAGRLGDLHLARPRNLAAVSGAVYGQETELQVCRYGSRSTVGRSIYASAGIIA